MLSYIFIPNKIIQLFILKKIKKIKINVYYNLNGLNLMTFSYLLNQYDYEALFTLFTALIIQAGNSNFC